MSLCIFSCAFTQVFFSLPKYLTKLVLEVTTGGVEIIQIGQNATLSRGTVCWVHT